MTRIALVDDHQRVRALLRGLLEEQPGFEVVGEADSGHEGLRLVREQHPDVVITDLKMQGMDGLEFTRELCAISGSIGVIILTMYGEHIYIAQAMEAGARGYVAEGGEFEELITAIRQVSSGSRYISPSLVQGSGLKVTG